jgi:hypothetical protein
MTIAFNAGQVLTASELNLLAPQYTLLGTAVPNTTNSLATSGLTLTFVANQTFLVEAYIQANSSVAGTLGLAIGWTLTGTVALVSRNGRGAVPTTTSTTASTSTLIHNFGYNFVGAVTYGTDTAAPSAGVAMADEHIIFTSGASGGTVTMTFSKATATAGTTTLQPGTFIFSRALA